jgi:hypothetical protein
MLISRVLPLVVATLVVGQSPSLAEPQSRDNKKIEVPPVPPEIQVPPGHSVYLKGYATGTQNYVCAVTKAGTLDWMFIGPEAALFATVHGEPVRQNMTHYLSENPSEFEKFRPTWRSSSDSSRVWGVVVGSSQDPAFVAPDAIPWLLLEVVGAAPGPTGGTTLSRASLVHRLNTSGGRKPTTGCTINDHIGILKFVPYAAEYYFYRAPLRLNLANPK